MQASHRKGSLVTFEMKPQDDNVMPSEKCQPESESRGVALRVRIAGELRDREYTLPVLQHSVNARDLLQIPVPPDGSPLRSFDAGLVNTSICQSSITFVDGEAGVLEYRGYPIEDLVARCSYADVAYLLIHGELPTAEEAAAWEQSLVEEASPPQPVLDLIRCLPRSSHPMSVLQAAIAALGVFYPESKQVHDAEARLRQAPRIVAQMSVLGAAIYRHSLGEDPAPLSADGDFVDRLAAMLLPATGSSIPTVKDALNTLLILHADHEQNASTTAVRSVASTDADPYTSIAAGIGALYGPLHGGANEAVLRMLRNIGDAGEVPVFLEKVRTGQTRLMGFGHRVYKNYDPRARIIKGYADALVGAVSGNSLLEVARALEEAALQDKYFTGRKLYPNVDFYSGLIYEALGLSAEMFTVMFAIARASGWFAHWHEAMGDPEQKLIRPRQIYVGARRRQGPAAT